MKPTILLLLLLLLLSIVNIVTMITIVIIVVVMLLRGDEDSKREATLTCPTTPTSNALTLTTAITTTLVTVTKQGCQLSLLQGLQTLVQIDGVTFFLSAKSQGKGVTVDSGDISMI